MASKSIPLRRRVFYLYGAVRRRIEDFLDRIGFYERRAATPHAVKRRVVRDFAARYKAVNFVETGTYLGDMIAAMLRWFDRLYSVELSAVLYEKAVTRFTRHKKVRILHGDSAVEIVRILSELSGRTLFWLDAHWSGGNTARGNIDTPIFAELDQIFGAAREEPVILVDDARCFVGTDGYPTIDGLRQRVARWRPHYTVSVERDIIRIVPPGGGDAVSNASHGAQ